MEGTDERTDEHADRTNRLDEWINKAGYSVIALAGKRKIDGPTDGYFLL